MFSTNQVRHLIVANSLSAEANVTDFRQAGVENSLLVTNGEGVAGVAGDAIAFKVFNSKGLITSSETIPVANITDIRSLGYLPTLLSVTAVGGIDYVVDTYYEFKLEFQNWGSLSAEDTYTKVVGFTTSTADSGVTTEIIVDGIIQELARALSTDEPNAQGRFDYTLEDTTVVSLPTNPYFTIAKEGAGNDAVIVLTELEQGYVTGKKDGRPLVYKVSLYSEDNASATVTFVPADKGVGEGKDIRSLEWFCKGVNGDMYRGMGYPHNFETEYTAQTGSGYDIVEISYFYDGENHSVQKSQKHLTVALLSTSGDFGDLCEAIGNVSGETVAGTGDVPNGFLDFDATVGGASQDVTFSPDSYIYVLDTDNTDDWILNTAATSFTAEVLTVEPEDNVGAERVGYIYIKYGGKSTYRIRVVQAAA